MLPQAGLIIPLYVVLASYHLTNRSPCVDASRDPVPFAVWTLRGFIMGIPKELEEAAMVDGSSRLGAFMRILLPLVAPGLVATVRLRLHHGLERVHLRLRDPHGPEQPDAHRLAVLLLRDEQRDGLGRAHGRVDAHRDSGRLLLPPVQRRIAFGLTAGAVKA